MCNLINFLGEQEIALQEQDISFDNEKSDPLEPLDHNGFNAISQKRFKCHICEDSECSPSNVCTDAITVKIFIFCLASLSLYFLLHE